MKFEIHSADCPKLCQLCGCSLVGPFCEHSTEPLTDHPLHSCTCSGSQMVAVKREELEELVEAASDMNNRIKNGWGIGGSLPDRIDAALQPFRSSGRDCQIHYHGPKKYELHWEGCDYLTTAWSDCDCDGPKLWAMLMQAARDEVRSGNARGALAEAVKAIEVPR